MSGWLGGTGSRSGIIGETEIDYEEGVYTATPMSAGGKVWSGSSYMTLQYTKIGRQVTVSGMLNPTSDNGGGDGEFRLSLPFTSGSLTDDSALSIGTCSIWNQGSTISARLVAYLSVGSELLKLQQTSEDGSSVTSTVNSSSIDSNFHIAINITYITAV